MLVTDAGGKPVENGWVDVRLDAPGPGFFFSTDLPLVEGTRLVEMRLRLKHGIAEWQYAWPIRGEYRLTVEAISADGKRVSQSFAITVRESAMKWLTLGGFTLGLFLLGFVAGRIFTATTGSAASLMLALFMFGIGLTLAVAQISQTAERAPRASLIIEPAVVGKPSRIVWRLDGGIDLPSEGATLSLVVTQLDEDYKVFAIEKLPVASEFALNFQFVDGSEHRVAAIAELPGRAPVRTEQRVSVTAVEPPATAALPALAFFLFVIALGLGAGRWSKRRLTTSLWSKG